MGFPMSHRVGLALVGLAKSCRFALLGDQLSCSTDCLHRDGIMFGRVADDNAEFAAFAAVNIDLCDHLGRIEVQTIGFRAIHDAEAAALLCRAFLIDDLRYVIHAT